ncbi:MAG TPA: NPCBM/NEW2 domain-containing protein [Pirellulales bacterium]|jgi:hypothetical protein|nr:NPCBM/NEW2 domain-containing protein [Pirellulales bacterium]
MQSIFFSSTAVGLWLWAAASGLAADPSPPGLRSATLVEGPAFHGRFVGAQSEPTWQLRFDTAGRARELPAEQLVLWGGFLESASALKIVLAGGGLVVADNVRIDDERLRGTSRLLGKLDVPLKLVAGIIFRPPRDRTSLDQLVDRIESAGGQTDRAILDNGDELAGTIEQLTAESLNLATDTGRLTVESKGLSTLIFNPVLLDKPKLSGLRMLVGFSDGSRVTASSLSADAHTAELKLAGGAEIHAATESIVALQPLGGRTVYLSDLKPAGYRHIPFLQLSWPLGLDHTALGGLLRCEGKLYLKGLGMHSPSRVTYTLNRPYRSFEAEVALDAESRLRGSVVFRVFVDDGSGRWRDAATSEIVRGGDPPRSMRADLAGAKRISLLVDFADHGDELDHADWLNPRLVE